MTMFETATTDFTSSALTISTFTNPSPSQDRLTIEHGTSGEVKVNIDTRRLRIVSVGPADAEEIHRYIFSDPLVMEKYATGITKDLEYVKARITTWTKRAEGGDPCGALTIRDKAGTFLGLLIVGHGDDPGTSELAYLVRTDCWNLKITSEAVGAVKELFYPAFRSAGHTIDGAQLEKVVATARPDNMASVKILEGIGAKISKTDEKHGAERYHFALDIALPDVSRVFSVASFAGKIISHQ